MDSSGDLPPEPIPIVQRATDLDTGIDLEIYNWLCRVAEAIQIELDGYTNGDEAEQERGIRMQSRLLNAKGIPELSERDIEIFISRLTNKSIREIMQKMCIDHKAIKEAKIRYEADIVAILQSDGHIIDAMIALMSQRTAAIASTQSSDLQKKLDKARKNPNLIVGQSFYPMNNLLGRYRVA